MRETTDARNYRDHICPDISIIVEVTQLVSNYDEVIRKIFLASKSGHTGVSRYPECSKYLDTGLRRYDDNIILLKISNPF